MKKIKYIVITTIALIAILQSCTEKDVPDTDRTVVVVDDTTTNDFDLFLDREFVEPYNIDFIYKWIDVESNFDYTLVPAEYEESVRMANLVRYLCLEAFEEVAPDDFLKTYFPKQIVMVGTSAFQNNGTEILGTAEGGVKIVLYDINSLDTTDIDLLYSRYFRTIFHEFAHILHQTKDFTVDFDAISLDDYVGDLWNESWNQTDNTSAAAGFISDYASSEPNEDFVELFAFYITNNETSWAQIIENAGDVGGPIITQKMEIVKKYLLSTWSIDIDALRDEIELRANNLDSQDLDNIN